MVKCFFELMASSSCSKQTPTNITRRNKKTKRQDLYLSHRLHKRSTDRQTQVKIEIKKEILFLLHLSFQKYQKGTKPDDLPKFSSLAVSFLTQHSVKSRKNSGEVCRERREERDKTKDFTVCCLSYLL